MSLPFLRLEAFWRLHNFHGFAGLNDHEHSILMGEVHCLSFDNRTSNRSDKTAFVLFDVSKAAKFFQTFHVFTDILCFQCRFNFNENRNIAVLQKQVNFASQVFGKSMSKLFVSGMGLYFIVKGFKFFDDIIACHHVFDDPADAVTEVTDFFV